MRIFLFLFLFPFLSFSQRVEKITILFPFDSDVPDPATIPVIDSVLKGSIPASVTIDAHCDAAGSDTYNDTLSERRAKSAAKLLMPFIKPELIRTSGHGKRMLLNEGKTSEERRLNRRAEIRMGFAAAVQPANDTIALSPDTDETDTTAPGSALSNIDKADVGSTIRLANINFYDGLHRWLPGSVKTLNELLETLEKNPTVEIEIQGHVCCAESGDGRDKETGDFHLSVNRAKAIYDYLVAHGISASRLSYKGFGSSRKLIRPERTAHDMMLNRRVEIEIRKK